MARSNEYLLNNALTDDFQQMLKPYHLTQRLLCASKYSIKDNFVLPNSRAYCGVVVFALCIITYANIAVSLETSCTIRNGCPLLTDTHNLLAHFVATACIIVQTESSIKLLIQLQSIDRKLKLFEVSLPYFVTKHWFSVFCLLMFFGMITFINVSVNNHFSSITYVAVFLMVNLDLDMLYATFVVQFLSSRLECFSNFFISYYKNSQDLSPRDGLSKSLKDLLKIPDEIFKGITLAYKLLQYPVFTKVVSTFIDSLVSLQQVIEWAKDTKNPKIFKNISVVYMFTILWIIKNIAFVIMFSMACERFYYHLEGTKNACASILEQNPETSEYRKTAKNVLRLCNANSTKMRVCGLFAVDAGRGLAATYCIVLLQFEFLK